MKGSLPKNKTCSIKVSELNSVLKRKDLFCQENRGALIARINLTMHPEIGPGAWLCFRGQHCRATGAPLEGCPWLMSLRERRTGHWIQQGGRAPNGKGHQCTKKPGWSIWKSSWLLPGGELARFGGSCAGEALWKVLPRTEGTALLSWPPGKAWRIPWQRKTHLGQVNKHKTLLPLGNLCVRCPAPIPNAGPRARAEAETFSKTLQNLQEL